MKNKKLILYVGISALCIGLGVGGIIASKTDRTLFLPSQATEPTYTVTLDKDNKPDTLTGEYQPSVTGNVKSTTGYDLQLTFINAKSSENNLVQLAPRGMIYNFGNGNKEFKGLKSVKFTGTGTVYFTSAKYGYPGSGNGSGAIVNDYIVLPSGTAKDVPVSNYFQLIAGDGGAVIESLELTYTCTTTDYSIKNVAGTYTGIGQDNYSYQLDIDNEGSAVLKSLNKATGITLNGTVTMTSANNVSIAFSANLTLNLYSDDYRLSLTHISKTGSDAGTITTISTFYRVYNVEDFENYSETGTGFDQAHDNVSTSGLRSAFYADYYSNNSGDSSPIGGSKWKLMGGSYDYITYTSNKGHNNSKAAAFKGNSNKLRYISMNSMYGVPVIIGAGAYLSFWARGAYTTTGLSTESTSNASIKLYAFYNSRLDSSNVGTRTELQFTVTAKSDWTEYKMPLDQSKFYYGFGFYCENANTTYTVIDDIKIYSVSPYAVPPVEPTAVAVSPSTDSIRIGGSTQLMATVSPDDATNKDVEWTSSNNEVATVDENGLVKGVSAGNATITATTVFGGVTGTASITVSELSYPEGTFKTDITIQGNTVNVLIAIGNSTNELVHVRVSNVDMVATSISYTAGTKALTIVTTGTAKLGSNNVKLDNITATFDPINDKLINVGFSNATVAYVLGDDNGHLVAPRVDTYFELDGTTSQLQNLFRRRFQQKNDGNTGGKGWNVDTSNADRLQRDTTNYVSGSGAMSVRPYANSNGGWCYAFNKQTDIAGGLECMNIGYWVYNSSEKDIVISMWVYTSAAMASNKQTGNVTAKAGQWTYVAMGFGEVIDDKYYNITVYNFQISVWHDANPSNTNATGTRLTFDNIVLF